MVTCDRCKTKRKCLKRMNIFRYPRIMVLIIKSEIILNQLINFVCPQIVHIKRFRYNNAFREKLSTDVSFPRSNLDLMPYLSAERLAMMSQGENNAEICIPNSPPLYDLIAVSHHSGSLQGFFFLTILLFLSYFSVRELPLISIKSSVSL
jgi:ubiquitin C-terminal hydrolase